MKPQPRAKLWIKLAITGRGDIGPGKVALLREIAERGSIAAAARAMGMSYRRAWQLVDELNQLFAGPLVETRIGGRSRGGASLTARGSAVIERYDAIVRQAAEASERALQTFADT